MSQYDDLCCNTMEKALAELLGISIDTIDMLGLTIEPDVEHDDFFYGYYVEFPTKEFIDKDILSQIEEAEMNRIPWGETKFYSEADFSNTSVDPFGYQADWEQEKYEIEHSPAKEQVVQKLEEIEEKIEKLLNVNTIDELEVKVLVFVAYSISEGYTKKIVLNAIPMAEKVKMVEYQKLLEKLYSANGRKILYKKYTGKELDYIPYYREIRNPLSHDILSGYISQNALLFEDETQNFSIIQIIENLLSYVKNLEE